MKEAEEAQEQHLEVLQEAPELPERVLQGSASQQEAVVGLYS